MRTFLSSIRQTVARNMQHFGWHSFHSPEAVAPAGGISESYRGLFQGVIESAGESSASLVPVAGSHGATVGRCTAKASGFMRIEVDRQKKATGAFMLFSDGEVLTGTIARSTVSRGHLLEAEFKLCAKSPRHPIRARSIPTAAIGRVEMRAIHLQRPLDNDGDTPRGHEDLNIRFV